jgi:serine/threonine-protein kinase RsbW
MIWVGSFKSLQSALDKPPSGAPLEVHTWLRSEIDLISPFVDWLISLIARSACVPGKEEFVELALREAITNAVLHGNRMDARKLVHVRCCCEGAKGVFIVIRDQGDGFDPNNVPNPLAVENLDAEHGRGIHLMKLAVERRSIFENSREPNKCHSPPGSTSEVYGALLEDLGPASAPSSWVDPLIPFRSRRFTKTGDPCVELFQVMPPVPHALRVNDACERRPSLQFLGRSFHRCHDFAPCKDQFLAKKMPRRGPIRGNDLAVNTLDLRARALFC